MNSHKARMPFLFFLLATFMLQPAGAMAPDPSPLPTHLSSGSEFVFAVVSDERYFSGSGVYDTSQYFRGALEAIQSLGTAEFLIANGDIDPVEDSSWTVEQVLGAAYRWHPVVGNHELPGQGTEDYSGANMEALRTFPQGSVNPGPSGCPETTFSFDYENAHFTVLNEYCDTSGDTATAGDIPDHLYDWLAADLASTAQDYIFVIGHEPAYPQPDADNGRLRHVGDSLDQFPTNRDRFWALLESEGVTAYFCGHTHNYSAVIIDGIWQIDSGHARGLGDTGAASTFVIVQVGSDYARFETYRDDSNGGAYTLSHTEFLDSAYSLLMPLIFHEYG